MWYLCKSLQESLTSMILIFCVYMYSVVMVIYAVSHIKKMHIYLNAPGVLLFVVKMLQ